MLTAPGDPYVRKKLSFLLDDYARIEKRSKEMTDTFGSQCTYFSPEISGFNQCIYYLLVEWLRPVLLVAILVLIDNNVVKFAAVVLVQHVYYLA